MIKTAIIFGLALFIWGCQPDKKGATDEIIEFVNSEIKDENKYWFKMKNRIDGSWNPVILVFGYVDNATICDLLLEYAEKNSPDVAFKCEAI
jgi:hypothetical protein